MTVRIGIEKMVGPGIILVHTFLHEAHPENARIKIQVLLRRPGDGRDVMKSPHRLHLARTIARPRRGRYCKCDNCPAL